MVEQPHCAEIQRLRAELEQLWQRYLDPHLSERERQRTGWAIDATYSHLAAIPEFQALVLGIDELGD